MTHKYVMEDAMPLLALKDVTRQFTDMDGEKPVDVLLGVSFEVAAGESISITGPSGSGKSTLLNIIGTLDRPTTGQVRLEGEDLSQLNELALASVRNRKIGFVFQSHHLLPQCSVVENVLVPTLAAGAVSQRAEAQDRAVQLLKRVGLGERLKHCPGQLSGGERQRVAVVRALINHPRLLLADEPTGALDRVSAEGLGNLLVELNQEEKVTLIVVTHASDLAQRMGRTLELQDGKVSG
jgi:lipoprotein-releasing system ATP-binding protein